MTEPKKSRIKDLTGQRFGRLVVVRDSGERSHSGTVKWLCICDCGKKVFARSDGLNTGHTRSCGCLRIKDLTGQRFGRLVVVGLAPFRDKNTKAMWCCSCDCGNTTVVRSSSLTSKQTKSCGCLCKEAISKSGIIFQNRQREEIKKMRDAGVKRCSCCKSIKNVDQFCKNRVSYDGLSNTCKECTKKIGKEYNLSGKGAITQAKFLLKRHAPVDIELPSELVEARAELIKIRRTIKEMTK